MIGPRTLSADWIRHVHHEHNTAVLSKEQEDFTWWPEEAVFGHHIRVHCDGSMRQDGLMRAGIVVEQNRGDDDGWQIVARASPSLGAQGMSSTQSEMLAIAEALTMIVDWRQGRRKRKVALERLIDNDQLWRNVRRRP